MLIGVLVLGVLAAAVWAWVALASPTTPSLITAQVARGDVEQSVLASGTLKPVRLVAVGAQVSGRLTALKVALGQKVSKGDLIAQIDSVTQENALRTAEAALANLRAQRDEKIATLALHNLTLARQQTLIEQKAIAQSDLQTADANVKTTQAQIRALDAQIIQGAVGVSTAQANLAYTRITAPIAGVVLSVVTQEGQTVNAAQSAPTIVILGQLDTMTIRAEISEADVVKTASGQKVYFTIVGDPARRYDATLASIEPAPESIRSDSSFSTSSTSTSSSSSSTSSSAVYYNGLFNVPNVEGRLRTYMTAQVHIVLGEAKGVLTIPSSALTKGAGTSPYVVRVKDDKGKLSTRAVTVGLNDKVMAEIQSGLKEGEQVVIGEASKASSSTSMGGPPPMGL